MSINFFRLEQFSLETAGNNNIFSLPFRLFPIQSFFQSLGAARISRCRRIKRNDELIKRKKVLIRALLLLLCVLCSSLSCAETKVFNLN